MENKFHVSLPCMHIEATENFYNKIIGATIGRKAKNWVDVNLFGHQITFTKSGKFNFEYPNYMFEKTVLPSFHFGVIMDKTEWNNLYEKLKAHIHIDKTLFLYDQNGEHQSYFIKDPNGYVIEFKCFSADNSIFKS
ncbi:VOC family protein [Ulvibacter antarcticus]|uniref:Extradiol dioxygenase family protein n=1 Tax=Ulvibacter antarcticus TaxID=442714 RepID=A0A3L9Z4R4_9FLAO|nr:VOC family protein [Ulvibacter antarcticus]RMA66449.1 extradiol dioxygenase family protein [Ulvibacter antarcticus]